MKKLAAVLSMLGLVTVGSACVSQVDDGEEDAVQADDAAVQVDDAAVQADDAATQAAPEAALRRICHRECRIRNGRRVCRQVCRTVRR